jgi:hypothetical protein
MTAYITNLSVLAKTLLLLVISNLFMLTAWYYHLKHLSDKPWYVAAYVSWGIAFFEYTVHIPANRIGHSELTLSQLQIMQVGMSLLMFKIINHRMDKKGVEALLRRLF